MALTCVVFNVVLCCCVFFIGDAMATQMVCPEINENSTFGERNMAWNCDLMRWRDALAGLKKRVEQQCNVTDDDQYWRLVFECPNFSEISCTDDTLPLNETDLFNCTISYCESGNYSDDVFLRGIWLQHFHTNKKFMDAYRSNLTHCLQSAGSAIDTYMTECSDVDVNSTVTEMSAAWMCELINWRNVLAEWKQAVEEDCSVNSSQPEWQASFQCPDFSEVECAEGKPPENNTDSLNCSINFCSSGEYTDTAILQIISGAQIDAYESAISITAANVTCKPRKYPDFLTTTQGVSESTAISTASPNTAAVVGNEVSTESTPGIDISVSPVDDEATTEQATAVTYMSSTSDVIWPEATPARPTTTTNRDSTAVVGTDFTEATSSSTTSTETDDITSNFLRRSTVKDVSQPTDGSKSTVGVTTMDGSTASIAQITEKKPTHPTSTMSDSVATEESTSSPTESATVIGATGSSDETTSGFATSMDLTTSNIEAITAQTTHTTPPLSTRDSSVASFSTTTESTSSPTESATVTDSSTNLTTSNIESINTTAGAREPIMESTPDSTEGSQSTTTGSAGPIDTTKSEDDPVSTTSVTQFGSESMTDSTIDVIASTNGVNVITESVTTFDVSVSTESQTTIQDTHESTKGSTTATPDLSRP